MNDLQELELKTASLLIAPAFIVEHQTQPCPTSCVTTCMAMITGCPVGVLMGMHDEYHATNLSVRQVLDRLGIPFRSFDSADRVSLGDEGVFLVSVPSLNIQGGMHQVVIEMLGDGDWRVYDPNQGRGGRLYYTSLVETGDDKAFILAGGYGIDAAIDRDVLIEWRAARKAGGGQ